MATEFPHFVDLQEGNSPEPGVHVLVDAAYLNSVNLAINTLENTMPGKADASTLAAVATSGSYEDLSGKPFIPSDPEDIGAQPAGDYATTDDLAGKADAAHTHGVEDIDAEGTADDTTFLRGDGTWAAPEVGVDEEAVRDIIGNTLVAGSNVTLTPDDDTIIISATGGGGSGSGTEVLVDGEPVETLDIDSTAVTATDLGAVPTNAVGVALGVAALDADGRVPTEQMPVVPTTVRSVSHSSSINVNPTGDGNRINITASGNITSLGINTSGAADGQVLRIAVLASGGSRTVTVASAVRTSSDLTRGPHTIPQDEVWIAAFEYVDLVSAWVLTAYTISES